MVAAENLGIAPYCPLQACAMRWRVAPLLLLSLTIAALLPLAGCGFAPKAQLTLLENQNRALSEQSRAQLAELENLRQHSRAVEDRLIHSEEDFARLEQRSGTDRKQLATFQRERPEAALRSSGGTLVPPALAMRLAELSRRFPSLQFDPQTGVSKLESDVLFDSVDDALRPEGEELLSEFARAYQAADVQDLKIMVVGHTDNQRIAGAEARARFGDNWRLSTARAHAVADRLRRAGVRDGQLGVAGFGEHQPIASNATAEDRKRNRRVEIFLVGPDAPVVGWTESIPSADGTSR